MKRKRSELTDTEALVVDDGRGVKHPKVAIVPVLEAV